MSRFADYSQDPARPSGPLGPGSFAFAHKLGELAPTSRVARGSLVFIKSALSIGLTTLVAAFFTQPLVFPSLGPTAYALLDRPHTRAAGPRNVFFGHLAAVLIGYAGLAAFGLRHAPSVLRGSLPAGHVGAAALALGLTAAVMVLVGSWHSAAGATALIVTVGLLTTPWQLTVLMVAVVMLILPGIVVNRLGLALPIWDAGRRLEPDS